MPLHSRVLYMQELIASKAVDLAWAEQAFDNAYLRKATDMLWPAMHADRRLDSVHKLAQFAGATLNAAVHFDATSGSTAVFLHSCRTRAKRPAGVLISDRLHHIPQSAVSTLHGRDHSLSLFARGAHDEGELEDGCGVHVFRFEKKDRMLWL